MTQPAADSPSGDREATKQRSRRLFWRLTTALVFLVVSTLGLVGYRIHRRYTILNILSDAHVTAGHDYPDWMWSLFGDYMYGLDSIEWIEIDQSRPEHVRLIRELNPQTFYWILNDGHAKSVYRFPDECGSQIREMTRLKALGLGDTRFLLSDEIYAVVSEEFLATIAQSSSLESVKLYKVELQGAPFSALDSSNTIQTIELIECRYPHADLSQLRNLKSLKSLTLAGNRVAENTILSIAELTQLEELALDDMELSLPCIQRLQALENLQTLEMDRLRSLVGIRFSDFDCLPKLKTLVLYGTDFDDEGALQLIGAHRLKTLDLSATNITDHGLRSLHALKSLRTLILSNTAVTDRAVEEFKQAVPGCQVYRE